MRISDNMRFDQVKDNLSKNRTEMSNFQNQAATQKRVTKPSDDPVAATRVLTQRMDLEGKKQYEKNLNYALSFLNFTDSTLEELTNQLVRAKELAISQANDPSSNKMSREVVATEIKQIYEQMVRIGNRKMGDRYIFGGYKTTVPPFSEKGNYKGDTGEMLINIDKGSFVAMNIPGSKIFLGEGLSGDGVSHSTTEQPKTLEELKSLEAENQISPELKDKEELIRQKQEELPEAKLRGLASVYDEGEEVVIDKLGPAYHKGIDLFDSLKQLEISLMTDDKSGVQESLEVLDEAISQVVLSRSQIGARVMTLDTAKETLTQGKLQSQSTISNLEDADIYEVVSNINKTEETLKASLQTSGKLMTPSLLDFLR